jgi:hypothetical protein
MMSAFPETSWRTCSASVTGARPLIRIHPERIVSWGLDG